MMNRIKLPVLFPVVLLVTAITVSSCATMQDDTECPPERKIEPGELDLIICQHPRPQICTREYDPVCASLRDGTEKTYATGCTSCADEQVVSYRPGSC